MATEVVHVYLAVPQTCNLIPKRGYNCGCCLLDAGNFVDVTMVTVVLYYQSLWVLVHTQTQLFCLSARLGFIMDDVWLFSPPFLTNCECTH